MVSLRVDGTTQALGHQAPLHREVRIVVEGGALIRAPAHGTMIKDDILLPAAPYRIPIQGDRAVAIHVRLIRAQAETDEADDHVIRPDVGLVVFQTDTITRSSLSSDGQVTIGDLQAGGQFNRTRDIEDDCPSARLVDRMTQRTLRAVIRQGSHMINLSPTSARDIHTEALGARESRRGGDEIRAP